MRLGHEHEAQPSGPPRCHFRATAVGEHRAARREGKWCHPHRAPLEVELLAGPQSLQQTDAFFHQVSPAAAFDTEHVELLVPVPDTDDVGDAAAADQIDNCQILGQLHGLVQREE